MANDRYIFIPFINSEYVSFITVGVTRAVHLCTQNFPRSPAQMWGFPCMRKGRLLGDAQNIVIFAHVQKSNAHTQMCQRALLGPEGWAHRRTCYSSAAGEG